MVAAPEIVSMCDSLWCVVYGMNNNQICIHRKKSHRIYKNAFRLICSMNLPNQLISDLVFCELSQEFHTSKFFPNNNGSTIFKSIHLQMCISIYMKGLQIGHNFLGSFFKCQQASMLLTLILDAHNCNVNVNI